MNSVKLSVVIVSWNTKELLRSCLGSLNEELSRTSNETIVVDNASTDGSPEMVKREFPRTVLVENKRNVGFPRANNQVIMTAQGEYILLLNPDVIVSPGSITQMLGFLEKNKEYGAVGPKIRRPDGSIQMECAGNLPTLRGLFFEMTRLSKMYWRSPIFGHWRMTYWDHEGDRDVQCLLGAAIMTRKSLLDKIGPLDEHMYNEDQDLCKRILKSGQKIRYLSTAEIVHYDGASRRASPKFYHHYQIAWHGLWHYFRKHRGAAHAAVFRMISMVCSLGGLIAFLGGEFIFFLDRNRARSFREKSKKAWAIFLWSITPSAFFKAKF